MFYASFACLTTNRNKKVKIKYGIILEIKKDGRDRTTVKTDKNLWTQPKMP